MARFRTNKAATIALIWLLAWSYVTARGQEPTFNVRRNIDYATGRSDIQHRNRLDLYWPKPSAKRKSTQKKYPVVVFVHGGAWKFGDKRLVGQMPQWLTNHHFALVSINYRFVPRVRYQEQAADVAASVAWVRKNTASFDLDPNKIFLMGHSAGAHLVALVGTDATYLRAQKLDLKNITGVIPVDGGGLDIPRQIAFAETKRNVSLYKEVFSSDKAAQQQASPITHVAAEKQIPAFLLLHAGSRRATAIQANSFAEKLTRAKGTARVVAARGKTHLSIARDLGKPDDQPSKAIVDFMKSKCEANDVAGGSSFLSIAIHRTGGFAGLDQHEIVRPNGHVEIKPRSGASTTRSLTTEALQKLNALLAETDWSKMPTELRAENVVDDFRLDIVIELPGKTYQLKTDGVSVLKHKTLNALFQLIESAEIR